MGGEQRTGRREVAGGQDCRGRDSEAAVGLTTEVFGHVRTARLDCRLFPAHQAQMGRTDVQRCSVIT